MLTSQSTLQSMGPKTLQSRQHANKLLWICKLYEWMLYVVYDPESREKGVFAAEFKELHPAWHSLCLCSKCLHEKVCQILSACFVHVSVCVCACVVFQMEERGGSVQRWSREWSKGNRKEMTNFQLSLCCPAWKLGQTCTHTDTHIHRSLLLLWLWSWKKKRMLTQDVRHRMNLYPECVYCTIEKERGRKKHEAWESITIIIITIRKTLITVSNLSSSAKLSTK